MFLLMVITILEILGALMVVGMIIGIGLALVYCISLILIALGIISSPQGVQK